MERTLVPETFALPSRRVALDTCREAARSGLGPILITGEAGSGKTWLSRRLAADVPGFAGWIAVDLTPRADALDLYRTVAYALGHPRPDDLDAPRWAIVDALREHEADGRRWGLVIDEAHLGVTELLEELRVLSNQLGEPGGFAGLALVGQTPLVTRIEARELSSLSSRLAARVHLRPIDADEAQTLIEQHLPDVRLDLSRIEHLHRLSGGNPRGLLRLAREARPAQEARTSPPPRLGPAKPPIHVEDGLIEVGWDDEADEPAPRIEPVEDHYATLQARTELASRQATPASADEAETAASAVDLHPQLWAEKGQGFAPYGQLFSRMIQTREAD